MNKLVAALGCLTVLPVFADKVLEIPPTAYDDDGCITNAGSIINAAYVTLEDDETLFLPTGHYKLETPIYMGPRGVKREIISQTGNRDDVILDGCGKSRVFQIGANYQWIRSLTITNGYANGDGGGIWFQDRGSTSHRNYSVISNVLITSCSATGNGGGATFYLTAGHQLTDVDVVSCTASGNGGGLSAESGIIGTRLFVTNCVSSNGGGGADLGREICLNDCVFVGNTSVNQGGGLYNSNDIRNGITNCVFRNNRCNSFGGGLALRNMGVRDTGHVIGCSFIDNYGSKGGGLYMPTPAEVRNCYFEGNSDWEGGGALACTCPDNIYEQCAFVNNYIVAGRDNVFGGGTDSSATFRHCVWQENKAGFAAAFTGSPKLFDCYVVGNVTTYGGNLGQQLGAVTYGNPFCQNCVFTGNRGRTLFNQGVFVNCTFAGNKVRVNDNRGVISPENATVGNAVALTNCVMAENWPWDTGSDTRAAGVDRSIDRNPPPAGNISHCLFSDKGVTVITDGDAYGNLVGRDPKFKDVASGDFWQTKGSALIDAGLEMAWMAGAQDLGEGYEFTFADAEKKTGLVIVYKHSGKKAHRRKIGDAPDIGAFEYKPMQGLSVMVK